MKPLSCSIVGVRNTGAVSRMKSFQNWPGTSGSSGGGASRISRSSKPFSSRLPANDSSTMKTTRCPREYERKSDRDAVIRATRETFNTVDEIGQVTEREGIDCGYLKSGMLQVA